MTSRLEHVNITVPDIDATAARMERLFGWHLRWKGSSIHGGTTAHVGTRDEYVAYYQPPGAQVPGSSSYTTTGGLNHIGIVVDDLDAIERKVRAEGLEPHSHSDYEPGRRFYFDDPDGIEIEVVCYG